MLMFCGVPVSFGAVMMKTLTVQSTMEAELIAVGYGSKKAVNLSNFLAELCLG